MNDLDRNCVLWIGDNRKKQTLSAFYAELRAEGCARLESVAMDLWLTNPDRMSSKRGQGFASLRGSQLRVARAWAIKRVARLIKYSWDGVINAATTNVTHARSEGLNSKIQ